MNKKGILFLFFIFFIVSCVEDRTFFARLEINNQSTSDIIYVLEWQSSNQKTRDTIITNAIYTHEETLLSQYLDELVSIEFIRISDQKNIVYFPKLINEDNYNQNENRTIFNTDNWNEFARDDYEYLILDTDFD
jgi:hypothetical protein